MLLLILAGLWNRRRPHRHLTFMITAFTVDLALILYIELTRDAVQQLSGGAPPLLWFHVGVSVAVVLSYIGMILLGRRLLRREAGVRSVHRKLGLTFCVLRTVNYITSFMI